MAAAEHFDVVVIGDGVPGLVCAGLLAHRQLRVRVVQSPPAARYEAPLIGLSAPITQRVMDELGLIHALRTLLDGAARPVTVALPDRRFPLEASLEARGEALALALPRDRHALLEFFTALEVVGEAIDPLFVLEVPPESFTARRQWKKLATSLEPLPRPLPWPTAPRVRQLVSALLALLGRFDDPAEPLPLTAQRGLWHLCHGVAAVQGGRGGLRAMLQKKLETFGGTVSKGRAVAFEMKRKRVHAVAVSDGSHLSAEAVIYTRDDAALAALTGRPELDTSEHGWLQRVRTKGALPVDLRDPCAWMPSGWGPASVRRHESELTIHWRAPDDTPPLETLTPFLDREAATPEPSPVLEAARVDPLGLYRSTVTVAGFKNLFRAGNEVMAGLGLEGELCSALQAAGLAAARCPRRR